MVIRVGKCLALQPGISKWIFQVSDYKYKEKKS